MKTTLITSINIEKAFLVGIDTDNSLNQWPIESSMQELSTLAKSSGVHVVGQLIQKMNKPSPTLYLGKGKLEELINKKNELGYTVAIFNDELSPRQQKNLEDIVEVKIIDRTSLILDIFAKRAHTSEGKLQVELAQYKYILPRLAGQWSHLERMGGGIGTRGPGETQIETDRRIIRSKIRRLETHIEAIRKHRYLYQQKRVESYIPVVALVGYTNAGKSTLLNVLSKSDVFVADKLFSTLDPVTRRMILPDKSRILITDTVGFIHRLPPTIVAAFRATLEELQYAELLLHVVDITHVDAAEQFRTVESILDDLGISQKPRINVINKIDLLINNSEGLENVVNQLELDRSSSVVLVSAVKGWGLDELLRMIADHIGNISLSTIYPAPIPKS
jgi:GTP-binding protein HflX